MDRCVLEIAGFDAGILVRDGAGFRFYAARPETSHLNGRSFRTLRRAEAAVRKRMQAVAVQAGERI